MPLHYVDPHKKHTTEVTEPREYQRLYDLAEQVYAGYTDYRIKTAAFGRQIPVFRLKSR